jgi:transcriptional regulator with XRE-family HTH domain
VSDDQSSNLDQVAKWVAEQREKAAISLQELAFQLREFGYPVSPNKLWRLEQGSSRIQKLDGELLMWLERVFGRQCPHLHGAPASIDRSSLVEWIAELHRRFDLSDCAPSDSSIRTFWEEALAQAS